MRSWIAPALLLLALAVPVLDPAVQLYYRDTGRFQFPVKSVMSERLHRLELPLWNPWAESGESFTSQLDSGLWHPLNFLHAILPIDLAFKLQHLSALLLALFGMYRLARRMGATVESACASAAAFAGSGFLISMTASNLLFALGLAALPLALEQLLAFLREGRPLALLYGSLALASCAWAGDAEAMLFGGYLGLAGALSRRVPWRTSFIRTVLWGSCALLLSMHAVLPTIPRFTHSARAQGKAGVLDDFALKPARLAGLALPWAFDDAVEQGESSNYARYFRGLERDAFADCITLGCPILLLAFFSRRKLAIAGALVLLAGACGSALFLGRPLFALLPGLQIFRYPEKLIGPASLILCAIASLGFPKLPRIAPLILAGVLFVVAIFSPMLRWPCVVQALLVAPLALRKEWLLAPVCALSAYLAVHGLLHVAPKELLHGPFPLAQQLEQQAGPSAQHWRVLTEGNDLFSTPQLDPRLSQTFGGTRSLLPDYNALARVESVVSYSALPDLDYEQAWFAAPRAMASLFSVGFVLRAPRADPPPGYAAGPHGILEKRFAPQPRAFLLDCAQVEPDATKLANSLAQADPHRVAFVRAPIDVPSNCTQPPQPLRIERPRPERMMLSIDSRAPSLLVIGEHFEDGWEARVDGAPARVVQVDLGAIGVRVPGGAHQIDLRFRPPHLLPGFAISIACALALLLLGRVSRPA